MCIWNNYTRLEAVYAINASIQDRFGTTVQFNDLANSLFLGVAVAGAIIVAKPAARIIEKAREYLTGQITTQIPQKFEI
jgi:hypothetical protein